LPAAAGPAAAADSGVLMIDNSDHTCDDRCTIDSSNPDLKVE
jgi:hypothetical protein